MFIKSIVHSIVMVAMVITCLERVLKGRIPLRDYLKKKLDIPEGDFVKVEVDVDKGIIIISKVDQKKAKEVLRSR